MVILFNIAGIALCGLFIGLTARSMKHNKTLIGFVRARDDELMALKLTLNEQTDAHTLEMLEAKGEQTRLEQRIDGLIAECAKARTTVASGVKMLDHVGQLFHKKQAAFDSYVTAAEFVVRKVGSRMFKDNQNAMLTDTPAWAKVVRMSKGKPVN